MRKLHLAQIYGVIQKQLVCLRAVSSCTGAFSLLAYLTYADVSIEKIFAEMQLLAKLDLTCIPSVSQALQKLFLCA